ncbi:MAG: DUF202 domain-containing protein [Candidatus Acidiferrales bacterium]
MPHKRTVFAWIRTSMRIIVFGLMWRNLGITLREFLRVRGNADHESGVSLLGGVRFMPMGIIMALVATFGYRTAVHQLAVTFGSPTGKCPGEDAVNRITPPTRFPFTRLRSRWPKDLRSAISLRIFDSSDLICSPQPRALDLTASARETSTQLFYFDNHIHKVVRVRHGNGVGLGLT